MERESACKGRLFSRKSVRRLPHVSAAFRNLKAAAHEFIHRRVIEEDEIEELRDLVDELQGVMEFLECELDRLDMSPEERAASDRTRADVIRQITEAHWSRN